MFRERSQITSGGGEGWFEGGTWIFFTPKRVGPEMLSEHLGENLKYLTSKIIKGSFLQSSKAF